MVDKQKSDQGNKQRIDWYLEAKFGLFIHWGAYSVAGVEASWAMAMTLSPPNSSSPKMAFRRAPANILQAMIPKEMASLMRSWIER